MKTDGPNDPTFIEQVFDLNIGWSLSGDAFF
jgi:hypothetical protein